jgi:lipopolysaccharide transport system ATP-binding protein
MSDIVIRAENLSKRYTIGQRHKKLDLREVIASAVSAPARLFRRGTGVPPVDRHGQDGHATTHSNGQNGDGTHIWALKDVSFEIRQGEVVGIIGRNGAGKSTLLKILARVTKPTTGYAEVQGRMGSLLEVGTGFHGELTGRENTYLNGAILGMKKQEVARKFDEIVAFAEIDRFIDTPVKHYSSGMYLRLAFAVAAHLDTEIILIDEILAVGDFGFQKKCLGRVGDAAKQGRTVLFISHSMAAVARLCPRAILLDAGGVLCDGPSHQVVGTYLSSGLGVTAAREWSEMATAPGDNIVRLRAVRVRALDGQVSESVDIREPVGVEMEYEVLTPGYALVPNYHFYNQEGTCVFIVHDWSPEWRRRPKDPGRYRSTLWVPGNYLAEGSLIVSVCISTYDPVTVHLHERDVVVFQVLDSLDGNSARGDYTGHMAGVVRPQLEVKTVHIPSLIRQAASVIWG